MQSVGPAFSKRALHTHTAAASWQYYGFTAYTAACVSCTNVNTQEGHCKPGEVLFGTDSHTCNAGAFGQFATGVGNTDAGFILGTGKLLIKVPPTMKFTMDGEMPEWLLAKDLILQIIGEISVAGE